jgi:thioredoxin 1
MVMAMAGNTVEAVSDEQFESDVVKAAKPTLVDFWAPWCGPCKAISPMVEELANTYQGKVAVRKMNIDDHPKAAGRYGIRAIPTLLLFKGGQVVDQVVGAVPRAKLEEMLSRHSG